MFTPFHLFGFYSLFIVKVLCDCPKESIPHGSSTISTDPYFTINYKCDEGFEMFGLKESYCFNGVWTSPVPICHAKSCSQEGFTSVKNGEVAVISQNSLLVVSCNPGYIMDGEEFLYCDRKVWSEPLPNCHSALDINKCDFEYKSLCGWTQDSNHQADWMINTRETGTKRTGPLSDHTLGLNHNGHYLYMESSVPSQPGYVSRLMSPVYPWYKSRRCFQLWYHMLGPEETRYMGDLEILLLSEDKDEELLFKVSGNQGEVWQVVDVFIERQHENFQIVVQARRGLSHTADIAIDDFSFYKCTNDSDLEKEYFDLTTTTEDLTSTTETPTGEVTQYTTPSQQNVSEDSHYYRDSVNKSQDSGQEFVMKNENKSAIVLPVLNIEKQEEMPLLHKESENNVYSESTLSTLAKLEEDSNSQSQTTTVEQTIILSPETEGRLLSSKETETFEVFPADEGKVNINENRNNSPETTIILLQETDEQITAAPSHQGEGFFVTIFKPEYIAAIAGASLIIIMIIVILSVIYVKRRQIWRRKKSDDQIQVLYSKNLKKTSSSQSDSV